MFELRDLESNIRNNKFSERLVYKGVFLYVMFCYANMVRNGVKVFLKDPLSDLALK